MEPGTFNIRFPKLFFIALFCLQETFSFLSSSASAQPAGCSLDFSNLPYKPIGECNDVQEKLNDWYGFPKTVCCQNALIVLSNALALEANNDPSSGNIFLREDEWIKCSNPFHDLQPNVSIQTCGFDNFFRGSGKCSSLELKEMNQTVAVQCSNFGTSSFDDACESCTAAITSALDHMLDVMKVEKNDTEKALCLVSVIISVIAQNRNDSKGISDFNRCLPALALPEPRNYIIKLQYSVAEALLLVIAIVIGLIFVSGLVRCMTSNQKKVKKPMLNNCIAATCSGLYWFSKAEIENAINYEREKKCLGKGSAGEVYKGMLPSGQLVAIKKIYKSNTSDSFSREIDGLSRLRHPNLVYLFGCCVEDGEQYLVYEYCPNGNLAQHILGNGDDALTWDQRVKILRGCVFALKYLHNHNDGCIVHRDIKLTNILLTHNMDPKLADFRLAKLLGMEESKVYTDIRGTIGYMDPEYMSNAKLTSASDIYSFGIVILQLLSGQRALDLDLDARDQLTRKARDVNMGKQPLTDFLDPKMKGKIVTADFESILQIAVLCVANSSPGRPTIDTVYKELEKACKNTNIERAHNDTSLSAATPSKSPELIQV